MASRFAHNSLQAASLPTDFDVLGVVRKHCRYKKQLRINYDFKWFLDHYKIDYSEYGYALGNIETSFNAIRKYTKKFPKFDTLTFQKAEKMLNESYSVVKQSRLAFDPINWVDLSTSPGYPWSNVHRTKRDAWADPDVRQVVYDVLDGPRPSRGIWTNACKTEPKKWEKIEANNTRVITGAPIEIQLKGTQLFAEMNENIHAAGRSFRIPSTVGWSHFYLGMHDLYRRMFRGGKLSLGAVWDYGEFDGSVSPPEHYVCRDLRFNLLVPILQTPEMYSEIANYYEDCIHSAIVMETGDLIQKHFGQNSGQTNTITDNSMINEFRWYYVWCCLAPEELHDLTSFREHCELVVCGDDSMITVDFLAQKILKPDLVRKIGESLGWKYKIETDGWQPLHQLSYCSKSFFYYYGYVLPVCSNINKQVASLLYGDKGKVQVARERLARALGIRVECYWLPKFRTILDEYIHYMLTNFEVVLKEKPVQDMPAYSDLLTMKRDHFSMLQLFLDTIEIDHRTWHPALRGPVPVFSNDHVFDVDFGSAGF